MVLVRPYAKRSQNNPHNGIKVQQSNDQESVKQHWKEHQRQNHGIINRT